MATTYTIKPGDTLSQIAAQYNTTVSNLASLNNLSDPNKIIAGKTLTLPTTTGTSNTTTQQTALFGPSGQYVYNVDKSGVPYGAPLPTGTKATTTSLYSNTPTDLSQIKPLPETILPENKPSYGDTTYASGNVAGVKSLNDSYIQDYNSQRAEAEKTQQTILSKLMSIGGESTSETRKDLSEQYGIQAKIDEIDTLNKEYNKLVAAKDQQIAQSKDMLGSMNFINNQIQQIEANAAPQLNRLSADINSKAAVLSANQDLVNKAVQDATADRKYQYDMIMAFYEMNKDTIDSLDSNYRWAIENKISEDKLAYERTLDEKTEIGKMMMDPALRGSGITTNDTLEEAYAKAARVSGSNYLADQAVIHPGETTTTTTKLSPTQQKTYEAYKSQIPTYKTKEEALSELDKVKFGIIKSIGQTGYDQLISDINSSSLPNATKTGVLTKIGDVAKSVQNFFLNSLLGK